MVEKSEPVPSRDMGPFPENFTPIFIRNQFRTTIETPTKATFPNPTGKCAIVTGSNTGLGFESSRQLLSLGLSHLVMAVRSLDSGKVAAERLRQANPSAKIDVWPVDLLSYDSIRAFIARCDKDLDRIDFAILNAGMSPLAFNVVPATGHETTVQVNHYSTALLTLLLIPIMRAKAVGKNYTPRITLVNSVMAHLNGFTNKDERPLLPSFDSPAWFGMDRYGTSKLLCQIFVTRLVEVVGPKDVIVNMVDPGLTKGTGLAREATGAVRVVTKLLNMAAGRPVEKGAATYVDAVLRHGEESHGSFLMNCNIAP